MILSLGCVRGSGWVAVHGKGRGGRAGECMDDTGVVKCSDDDGLRFETCLS
jgi:hypothetical protein